MLTYQRLIELLEYNPDTGVWEWVKRRQGVIAGRPAGCLTKRGYRLITIDGKQYRSARLAWLYMEGYFPELEVDHINRVRADDRWVNLREASHRCNIRNAGEYCTNTSGVKGVTWSGDRKKWQAQIGNGGMRLIARFNDFNEAVLARLAAEQCLGWEQCNAGTSAYQYALENNLIVERLGGGA